MRYERKYKFKRGLGRCLANFLICNKFKETYPKRVISSLYYDNLEFRNYYDSINGLSKRCKYRIRFYNNNTNNFQIEIKNKSGELGNKFFPSMKDIFFDNLFNLEFPAKSNLIGKNKFPAIINKELHPIVFINYNRRYFISEEEDMRITIDSSINFSSALFKNKTIFIDSPRNNENSVLELKFNQDQIINEKLLDLLTNNFNLSLDRSSKFCDAVEKIYAI